MFKQSLWALAAAFCFSMMAAFVKLCSDQLGTMELVFYRSLIGVISIAFFVYKSGETIKTPHIMGHIKRSVLGTLSVALWFFAIGRMSFGACMTLIYTTPLFMAANFTLLAILKKQPIPWVLIGAILVGFTGVTTVLQPSFEAGELIPALVCLFVSFIDLLVYWQMKELGNLKEPSWKIVFYFTCFGTAFGLIGAFVENGGLTMPTMMTALGIVGMGICATLGQLCTTRSYAYGNMLLSSCLGFSAIPISAVIEYFLFGKVQEITAIVGMTLIIAAGMTASVHTKKQEAKNRALEEAKAA